jgi:hypothetical protein
VLKNSCLWLISCRDLSNVIKVANETLDIAIVADWSRIENQHGVVQFFNGHEDNQIPRIYMYGKGSDLFIGRLNPTLQKCFINCGRFLKFSDIHQKFILVPIYRGAGIKAKVLDCINHSKIVLGTSAAFSGFPPKISRMIGVKITQPSDIYQYIEAREKVSISPSNLTGYLQKYFSSITVLVSQ